MTPIESSPTDRFEIHITSTARSYRPDDEYRIFDQHKLIAESIDDVREKLVDLYGNCKRVPIYVDTNSGETRQQKWRQQDWVSVMKLMGEVIDPRQLKR